MGLHKTYAVLSKNGKRVEVQPNEVVESEVKLWWGFKPFNENILDTIAETIATQQKYVDVAKAEKERKVSELKAKHKAELEAIVSEEDAKIQWLEDRVAIFEAQKTNIADNIDKAKLMIQNKIDSLMESAKSLDTVAKKEKKPVAKKEEVKE